MVLIISLGGRERFCYTGFMNNSETNNYLETEAITHEITMHVEEMYSPEKLTTSYINKMFGLEDGDLSQPEIDELARLFKATGEILLRTNLEKGSFENLDEVKEAIREHAEQYSKFGAHDLIHVVIEHDLENSGKEESQWKPAIPEFLQDDQNNLQAIREEFPAVLWTPIGQSQPIFLDLMTGNSEEVIKTLRNNYDGKKVDRIAKLLNSPDYGDFKSLCEAYTEVLLYLTYKVAKKDSGFENEELEEWKHNYKADQETVKQSILEQLQEFNGNIDFINNDKGDKTEQLFIKQAHSIFENYSADKKVSFKNFMELAKPLVK